MKPPRLTLLAIAFVFLLQFASAQSNIAIHGILQTDQGAPTANATILLIAPDALQQLSVTTNQSGRFNASVPPGQYTIRAWVPNTTGELWHDRSWNLTQASSYAAPILVNRSLPYLRGIPLFSPVNAPEQLGNSTARGIPAIIRLQFVFPGPESLNRTIRAEVELRYANGTLQSQASLGPIQLPPRTTTWLNDTLPNGTVAYHEREQTLRVSLRIRDNSTSLVYDNADGFELRVLDECRGDQVALAIQLKGFAARSLCMPSEQRDVWRGWTEDAEALRARDLAWSQRAQAEAPSWDAQAASRFWAEYRQNTSALRPSVVDVLDDAQTDTLGQPNWADLDALRAIVTENETKVRSLVLPRIQQAASEQAQREDVARIKAAAMLLGASVVGAALGVPAAVLVTRTWKQRTEYWIGYSAKGQPGNPLLWIAVLGTAILVLGLAAAWPLGLIDWLHALAGGG